MRQRGIFSEVVATDESCTDVESKASDVLNIPKTEKLNILPTPSANTFVSSRTKKKKDNSEDYSSKKKESMNKSYSKVKELYAGFPPSAYEPKISLPFEPLPGQPPRNIEIQRKKRLYSSHKIEDLLKAEGVDGKAVKDVNNNIWENLPLAAFDNSDFDVFPNVEDWMKLGINAKGEQCGLPAKVLFRNSDETASWLDAKVLSYDDKKQLFLVEWVNLAIKDYVQRMEIVFAAENPFNFAKRIGAAHKLRKDAIDIFRYNLYIDCMPVDGLPALDSEQMNRILSNALSTKSLKNSTLDTTTLLNEINLSYSRSMNKIILDLNKEVKILPALELSNITNKGQKKQRKSGIIQIPYHNFAEEFSNFSFHTLYTKLSVIKTIVKIKAECNKLSKLKVFKIKSAKPLKIEEYASVQAKVLKDLLTYLNDTWISGIKSHVQNELKGVGKGWFDLNESNIEIYNFSKLKKLFRVINFTMQDNLRFMVEKQVNRYVEKLLELTSLTTTVKDTNNVNVKWDLPVEKQEGDSRYPIYLIDIIIEGTGNNAKFKYSTDIGKFIEMPLICMKKPLKAMQKLTQVEKLVMVNIFWSYEPFLATLHPSEVVHLEEKLQKSMEKNIDPLRKYLSTYDKHLKFLHLDIDQYFTDLQDRHDDIYSMSVEIKKLVQKHINAAVKIESTIPITIDVGLSAVNASSVRETLASKHRDIAQKLLILLQKQNLESTSEVNKIYSDIFHRMAYNPSNIEDLTELEEFLGTIENTLKVNSKIADKLIKNFELLDEFKHDQPFTDFQSKWNIIGWPKKILDRKIEVEEKMLLVKAGFDNDMIEEQEGFVEHLKGLKQEVLDLNRFTNIDHVDQVSTYVTNLKDKLAKAAVDAQTFNSREVLFNKEVTEYKQLIQIKKEFEPYCLLWESVSTWLNSKEHWMHCAFTELDSEHITKTIDTLSKNLNKCSKTFERQKINGCLTIAQTIRNQVQEFKPYCPMITALRNPGMKDRHWEQLSSKVGTSIVADEKLNLTKIFEIKLVDSIDQVIKVGEKAGKEFAIENSLMKMKTAWEDFDLIISPHRNTGTYILKGVDDVMALLDEQITMTQAMGFSAFKKPFEEEIESWDKTLGLVSEVIDEWIKVQRNWLYLQPIFDSDDIQKRLPLESKRFNTVDKNWRQTLARAHSHPKAIKFCDNKKLLEKLQESNKFLDLVQKGLSDYLETKRGAFSRFYFLSNDELLEILSQTKDPTRVQPHLKKCFEAIKSVDFQPDLTITAMNSSEGESLQFPNVIDPKNANVEDWMNGVETEMKSAVKTAMYESIVDYSVIPRGEWIQKWPGMCVLNGSQVHWTTEIEQAMDSKGNAGIQENYEQQLKQLEVMVSLVRGELSKLARTSIGALAVIDVHARDVTKSMVDNGVSDKNDFEWISQLRYYWEGDGMNGDLWAMMVSSKRPYGYEYLGNSFRLVITPLTDKCYLTLMGALQMILGGAPAGPAGTGKTETTKDLAKALAKQCIVFNCSDSMDYKMTGKFFKGLASCGAWACFDEFNRILIEVLSVIAQQIMSLQQAVMNNKKRIDFEGTDIVVSDQFAVFITMNPGYAGRTELPDNLKALFRPVAMMVPDYGLIGEIMLFAYGFENARECARKMVATFQLCSEQLSSQDHYDYGMRAVKTVIVATGNLKREDPDMDEELLMLRGLMDVNLPKFLAHDLPLFRGIMSDLFPGKEKPAIDYGDLTRCIKLACENRGLQCVRYFIEKCIQLYEMIVVRHGLMVVGPSMGGKSESIYVLQEALTMLKKDDIQGERYEAVELHYLNPKSITMGQLYGQFDPNTHEWKDGVLATIIRICSKSTTPDLKWVLFDGPVDTLWIESMNTVLDDNKKLCLNSGEIVALSNEMTMMFEPKDLSVASPATVSRCGMIYMEPHSLGFWVIIKSWLEKLPKCFTNPMKETLMGLCETYLSASLTFLRRSLKEPVPTIDNNLICSLLNYLDCYFNPFIEKEGFDPPSKENVAKLATNIPGLFIFSLIWSIGITSNSDGRERWDSYLRFEMDANNFENPLPEQGLIYDYIFDEDKHQWILWTELSPEFKWNPKLNFSEINVPTKDTTRYTHLLNMLVLNNKHVLVTGPTGTGKSVNVQRHLQNGMSDKYIPLMFTFSAQTSANQTQDIIDGKTEKRRKGVYGAPVGRRFIIFIDDVNMPQREIFFAQPPIEILRQLLCAGGWYDRTSLEWRNIIDTTLVLACGPPGGGRNPVSERFFRHFNIIGYTSMDNDVMYQIFSSILTKFLEVFDESIQTLVEKCVWSSIKMYNSILDTLLPTPAKSHYTFNLRDLGKVFQGILMVEKK